MSRTEELKQKWETRLRPLVGRTITNVTYLGDKDGEELGWDSSAVLLHLDDGTLLYPSADDEGNGPGALFIQPSETNKAMPQDLTCAPVI